MDSNHHEFTNLHNTNNLSIYCCDQDSIIAVSGLSGSSHALDPLFRLRKVCLSWNRDPLFALHHQTLDTHCWLIHIIWLESLDAARRDDNIVSFSDPVCLGSVG